MLIVFYAVFFRKKVKILKLMKKTRLISRKKRRSGSVFFASDMHVTWLLQLPPFYPDGAFKTPVRIKSDLLMI